MRRLLSSDVAGSRLRAVIARAHTTLARITTHSIVPPAEILTVRLAVFEAKRPDVVTTQATPAPAINHPNRRASAACVAGLARSIGTPPVTRSHPRSRIAFHPLP